MPTEREILTRIRWDSGYGKGRFEVACLDRFSDRLERFPFDPDTLQPGSRELVCRGEEGRLLHIPLHRIREIYRDGELIWRRGE